RTIVRGISYPSSEVAPGFPLFCYLWKMPTFHEAVISKYLDDDEEEHESWMRVPKRTHLPPLLSLSGIGIQEAGDEQELQKICARVTDLDLSKNEFKDFNEVTKILRHTPCLNLLNLNHNIFEGELSGLEDLYLTKLSCLVLNGTMISWESVHQLLKVFPNLQELYLSNNNYEKVEASSNVYPSVKKVYFNDNPVNKWNDVEELGSIFPNLEHLILVGSSLQSIQQKGNNCGDKFPQLISLSLNSTDINNWESVDAVNNFPKLTELRLHHSQLGESYEESVMRSLTIARLPKIEKLNGGGVITFDERIDAERAFIRHYKKETPCPSQARLDELIGIHGDLVPLPNIKIKKQKEVTINIRYEEQPVIERTVSVYLKIVDLLKSLENEFGLSVEEMDVAIVDDGCTDNFSSWRHLILFDKKLFQMYITSGDLIFIKRRPFKRNYLKKIK
ncbi:unnamed protein product, partial [Meganyctiphanes norvegica]